MRIRPLSHALEAWDSMYMVLSQRGRHGRATIDWHDRHEKYELIKALSGIHYGTENKPHVLRWILDVDGLREELALCPTRVPEMAEYEKVRSDPQASKDLQKELADRRRAIEIKIENAEKKADQLRDNLKSYLSQTRPSNLTGNVGREFVELVCKRLIKEGMSTRGLRDLFIQGDYKSFFNALSEEKKKFIRDKHPRAVPEFTLDLTKDPVKKENIRNIYLHRSHKFSRINDEDTSRIAQTFFYLDPHSAHNWRNMVEGGGYDQYEECKQSIRRFVAPKPDDPWVGIWAEFVASPKFDGVVMLGGGGIEKDRLIVKSILSELRDKAQAVRYAIVDVSIYMLMDTISRLDQLYHDQLAIVPLIWDFLEIKGAESKLVNGGRNVAWFLPGGTIGNLDETVFLKQLKEVMQPGDLFIVGIETWGEGNLDDEKAMFEKKYKESAVDDFLEIPMRTIWDGIKTSVRLSKAMERKTVAIVPQEVGDRNEYSSISESITVEISVEKFKSKPGKLVFITSTRYKEQRFIEAVQRFGAMDYLHTIESPDNRNYKQIVFKAVG